jgi:dTMP kinase
MNKGKFIVVEGVEGAGKSTAIANIAATLTHYGIDFIQTREPGGTPLAEQLRAIVKSPNSEEKITPQTELFLMYASRSQLLENVIKPALAKGLWVIGDRHDLSSRAYQGGGRKLPDTLINTIAEITLSGFKPDFTFLLDIDPKIGLARAQARGDLDRIEQEQLAFFQRVRDKYLQLASQDKTIYVIDASKDIAEVQAAIEQQLALFINSLGKMS